MIKHYTCTSLADLHGFFIIYICTRFSARRKTIYHRISLSH